MALVKVTVRPSPDLRCAFCHGELDEEPRPCRACFTALHDECWDDAGVCPTLGCATWARRIRVLPRLVVASWWLFGLWALCSLAVYSGLVFVVPAFAKMFTETGLSLPWPTEVIFALSSFACSWGGALLAGAVVPASVIAFRRWRRSRWLVPALYTAIWLSFGVVGLTAFSLFLPLTCLKQKL